MVLIMICLGGSWRLSWRNEIPFKSDRRFLLILIAIVANRIGLISFMKPKYLAWQEELTQLCKHETSILTVIGKKLFSGIFGSYIHTYTHRYTLYIFVWIYVTYTYIPYLPFAVLVSFPWPLQQTEITAGKLKEPVLSSVYFTLSLHPDLRAEVIPSVECDAMILIPKTSRFCPKTVDVTKVHSWSILCFLTKLKT